MSARHYPRYDSRRPLRDNTTKRCQAKDCTQLARWQVFVQFSYFRGEDEAYSVCETHRKFDNRERLDDWVESMADEEKTPDTGSRHVSQ